MRLSRWLVTGCVLGVLAACGGANPASTGDDETTGAGKETTTQAVSNVAPDTGGIMSDPCVLEPDEINALIEINRMVDPTGADLDDLPAGVVQQSSGSSSVCHWENDYALVALTIEEYDPDMYEMSRDMEGSRPVTGLGDDAFFDGFLDVLFVRVGDLDFQLQIVLPLTDMTREEVDDVQIRLARLVLDRI